MAKSLGNIPWSGIVALFGMALCLVASAVVVRTSYDQPVASWRVQPAVLLAVFSGASSILFTSALDTGITVRFWLSASRETPLAELHYIWDHGRGLGLIAALRSGSKARTVVLLARAACVIEFLAGPFLQRATYQAIRNDVDSETLSVDIASRIPDGWFGDRVNSGGRVYEFRHGLAQLGQWSRKEPIATHDKPGYICNGSCDGSIWGAGFAYDCWTTEEKLDMSTTKTDNSTVFLIVGTVKENTTAHAFLHLRIGYLSYVDGDCMGTITTETCHLTSATVEYPVTVYNSTVSLRTGELSTMRSQNPYWSPGDSPKAVKGTPVGPLSGLRYLVYGSLFDNATKSFEPDLNRTGYVGPGITEDMFYIPSSENPDPSPATCRVKFASPAEYVLSMMHELMFRFALAAGNGTETQVFAVTKTARTLVLQVDPGFLAAGVVFLACGIALVSALMWNWWLLGRPVTLSPLETAAALGKPILEGQPDATLGKILAETRTAGPGTGARKPTRVLRPVPR
ncbi:hypothetical protein B0H63DRAFT_443067 [Podospora didyma]|uniref:Uncharacterized protein n=1 Tax=Podospora didyma TaxID=330526 RepID=A0AAE0U6J9_9PEZI|nr:hypothetical protein B0H63DRAFT_443067 [Podospora didyma]